ncbi:hypothetical protein DL96DRAFT_1629933 [Flagelloscypha sp. PMI_526]|nr:hypothetical protein DL96DRAFT_1629933 [Flagelloscypha sp. PMI_526]
MFLYELPTTGLSLRYASTISEATQIRAALRNALKEAKRTDHAAKDYLLILKVVDDYLPQLNELIVGTARDELGLKTEPVFSWRTTLSPNLFNATTRQSFPGLHADWAFTLLVQGFTLSNYARTIVTSLGAYEHDRAIRDAERKSKDDSLNFAVDLLRRASGAFAFISETVLPQWENSRSATNDASLTPGPPLPKSHPSPALTAKLHLECASLYSTARSLVKPSGDTVLSPYLSENYSFHSALGKKWLGVEAGEKGGVERAGEAVGFMVWAKEGMNTIFGGGSGGSKGKGKEKDGAEGKKGRVGMELESVEVHFQPVPAQQHLQTRIPDGTLAVPPIPFVMPQLQKKSTHLEGEIEEELNKLDLAEGEDGKKAGTYAGSGAYY